MRSKNLLCSDGLLASILTNGQQIMNNEFKSAAQKKGGGRVMRNYNESHWSGLM
jgi:hypothetical protein